MGKETKRVEVLKGVIRNLKTGTYHRGAGNAPNCNHGGSRRIPSCISAKAADAEQASPSSFCRKCFPGGKPDLAALARVGGDA